MDAGRGGLHALGLECCSGVIPIAANAALSPAFGVYHHHFAPAPSPDPSNYIWAPLLTH